MFLVDSLVLVQITGSHLTCATWLHSRFRLYTCRAIAECCPSQQLNLAALAVSTVVIVSISMCVLASFGNLIEKETNRQVATVYISTDQRKTVTDPLLLEWAKASFYQKRKKQGTIGIGAANKQTSEALTNLIWFLVFHVLLQDTFVTCRWVRESGQMCRL